MEVAIEQSVSVFDGWSYVQHVPAIKDNYNTYSHVFFDENRSLQNSLNPY